MLLKVGQHLTLNCKIEIKMLGKKWRRKVNESGQEVIWGKVRALVYLWSRIMILLCDNIMNITEQHTQSYFF